MYRFLLIPALLLSTATCQAGYFDLTLSSFTSDQYFNVANGDGNDPLGQNDIVRSVQLFTYATSLGATRTALAISIAEVSSFTAISGGRGNFAFAAPTTSVSGVGSISALLTSLGSADSNSVANLDSTGAGGGGDVFALLTTSGSKTLAGTGFDFTAANFGLTASEWEVDLTASFSGSNYQQWLQNYTGGGTVTLDPVNDPETDPFLSNGSPTNYVQGFGYTITQVRDDDSEYVAGSGGIPTLTLAGVDTLTPYTYTTANLGTNAASGYGINWVSTAASGVPTGTDFKSSSVTVSMPAPGSVPEPSTLLVLSAVGFAGVVSRRRRS